MSFYDMYELEEDARIKLIGETVMCKKHDSASAEPIKIAVMVDHENSTKADRYIQKLKERYPGIRVVSRACGPVPNTETFCLSPPLQ